jgi:hypothetical protein
MLGSATTFMLTARGRVVSFDLDNSFGRLDVTGMSWKMLSSPFETGIPHRP